MFDGFEGPGVGRADGGLMTSEPRIPKATRLLLLRMRYVWPFKVACLVHNHLPGLLTLSWALCWRPRRRALARRAPLGHLTAASLAQTCNACPAQWEGELTDGRALYVRYRYGRLQVEAGDECVLSVAVGDRFHGRMETDEMLVLTGLKVLGPGE